MANFFIRSKKQSGKASLWYRVQRPNDGIDWWINSHVKVTVEAWNRAQGSAAKFRDYTATPEGKQVQDKIDKIQQAISVALDAGIKDKAEVEKNISDVVNEGALREMAAIKQRKAEEDAQKSHIILNYYDYFLNGIKSGHILQKRGAKRYAEESIRIWSNFGKFLKEFTPQNMTFEEISKRFAADFILFLNNKGMMPKTANKYVICFRRLCNAAADDGFNNNVQSTRLWGERDIKDNEKRAEIALSDAEVDALYNMQLSGIREQVRDMWVLGFLCGQRVSDFTRLTRDNFKMTPNGVEVIVLQQQKTKTDVVIPITDDRVNELCEKYGYNFPSVDSRDINRYIKDIAHTLSEQIPSLRERVETEITIKEKDKEQWFISSSARVEAGEHLRGDERKRYKEMKEYSESHNSGNMLWRRNYAGKVVRERWELITTHTARRSAVTSLYDSGLYDVKEMMSISGHTTLKNFEQYIKRGAVQQAEKIAAKARQAKELKLKKKQA